MPVTGMNLDWRLLLPEILLTVFGVLGLLVAVLVRQRPKAAPEAAGVAILGTSLALGAVVWIAAAVPLPSGPVGFALAADGLALFFKGLCILATLVVLAMSVGYDQPFANRSEFYALMMFAQLAMCLLCSAADIITLYLSLEFLSLVSYLLAGLLKQDPRSNEAAVKYFLFGAVSAAIMLYGLSIVYGLTGATDLGAIAALLAQHPAPVVTLTLLLVSVGLLFKVSAAPFHMWTPDVYQGAPLPVAAFLSVASKAAGFAVLARVASVAVPAEAAQWPWVLALISAVTMTVGNLSALRQQDIVRMLAYSTIAQAGYVLMGLAALAQNGRSDALSASMMYLLAYLVMNLGAFAIVVAVARTVRSTSIADYRGLAYRTPWLAWSLALFLISLSGLPPTAGFVGKFFLFQAVLQADLTWLALVALLNSVVAVYYYFNVLRLMVFNQTAETSSAPQPALLRVAILATLAGTLLFGLLPSTLMQPATRSSVSVLYRRDASERPTASRRDPGTAARAGAKTASTRP